MVLTNIPESCNYIEIVLVHAKYDGNLIFDQPCRTFQSYMSRIRGIKSFEKEMKVYQINDMFYENYMQKDNKIFTKTLKHIDQDTDPSFAICYYRKEKHPFHAFPSTLSIHNIFYIQRLTYRLHNRLYLNFETQHYPNTNNSCIRKIYINYNHDKSVDHANIDQNIKRIINMLQKE